MLPMINCPRCGQAFRDYGTKLCPNCLEDDHQTYKEARKYISEHQGSSIPEVADTTGIKAGRILQLVQEGFFQDQKSGVVLINCLHCGRLFNYTDSNICPDCIGEDNILCMDIRMFLYDNQGATISEISDATKIKEDKILQFIRVGDIERREEPQLECKGCGEKIPEGEYCKACQWHMNLANEPKKSYSPAEIKEQAVFRTFKERRK